jgi:hypothetical protein
MNMKTDWIVKVYKKDRRVKAGERFVAEYPFNSMDRDTVDRELRELTVQLYPQKDGWRFEVKERYITVKNLMTGKDVQIEADTPWSCRPDSEAYWSM